jgi:hypothetical protein
VGDRKHVQPPSQTRQEPDDGTWIRPGHSVPIGGVTLEGGRFYFGRTLRTVAHYSDIEPALVNPTLPINFTRPDRTGACLRYWPSYRGLSPEGRAAYVSFLTGPRNSPQVPIGYVFLYFYGLERRALGDAQSLLSRREELGSILAEVDRLLGIYGSNPSFHGYASHFISILGCLLDSGTVPQAPPPAEEKSWELPVRLQLGLGRLVASGRPVPADWALAWVHAHPEIYLRTPANRCREEFDQLFSIRYAERYGEGMALRPNKTPLKMRYHPASPSFGGTIDILAGNLPDVTVLTAPVSALKELSQKCTDALDSYSRWVGRHPDEKDSLAGAALLPQELAVGGPGTTIGALTDWIKLELADHDEAVIEGTQLIRRWDAQALGKLKKPEASALAQLLDAQGYGIEPDVRFGGPSVELGAKAVIFRLEGAGPGPGPDWQSAAAMLQLAALVASPGLVNSVVLDAIARQVQSALELPETARRRIHAHLRWAASSLSSGSSVFSAAERRFGGAPKATRERLGEFLVDVATAVGEVGPGQVSVLAKAFSALGLTATSMYSLVHQRSMMPTREPVEIRPARRGPLGQPVPPPPPAPPSGEIALDLDAVQKKLAESAKAAAMLGEIFSDEDDPVSSIPTGAAAARRLSGTHAALLRELATRASWSRAEFAAVASRLGLLPSGALDSLNETALEVCGDPLLDGDSALSVNPDVLKELMP